MTGILGGTFDPVHLGHLHIASQVVQLLGLQQLQFMPCAQPVHRDLPHASNEQRCRMIELALRGCETMRLNRLELERDGPSYSVDSLREMRQQTSSGLLLVLGADAFNGFGSWKAPSEILSLAHLVVCGRPGFSIDTTLFAEHQVGSALELLKRDAGAILPLPIEAMDCSSSLVRAELLRGNTPRQYLPAAVADYIDEHNLYRKPSDTK
jgi:nicotinate-nucleotide adenylyltransferase